MNVGNTPVHINLWHKELWYLVIANFCLMASVYVLLPVLPVWLLHKGTSVGLTSLSLLAYGVGLYLPGPFVSGWVQQYRRNHVCQMAMVLLMTVYALLYFFGSRMPWMILTAAVLTGCFLSLAQMVLSSTLVVDTCESIHRTEANYASSWFGRMALALGPLAGFWVCGHQGFRFLLPIAIAALALSFFFIALIRFPFKAPEENMHRVSLDRFFLTHGFPLYVNLLLITAAFGLILSTQHGFHYFAMMMAGFLLAILAEKYVFANAELKSESIVGCVLIGAAILLLWLRHGHAVEITAAVFSGLGIGIIGSRFLLFFIKLAKHCERGTSQSTFFLGWETGLALGLAAGYYLHQPQQALLCALVVICVALGLYNFVIHPWYLHNKNR